MDSRFEYNPEQVLTSSIYVNDIGNCALEATDSLDMNHYLVIVTRAGMTHIYTWGPVVPDIITLPKNYKEAYLFESYKEDKLEKFISSWVLGPKGTDFLEIKQIEQEDALNQCRHVGDYMKAVMED